MDMMVRLEFPLYQTLNVLSVTLYLWYDISKVDHNINQDFRVVA